MMQEHNRFIRTMDYNQKVKYQRRIMNMEQSRDRIRTLTQEMHRELNQKADSNPKIIAGQAREINRVIKEWQNQYHSLGSEIKE
jgi:hypothetical protein